MYLVIKSANVVVQVVVAMLLQRRSYSASQVFSHNQ